MKKITIVTAIVTIVLFSLEACCTYNLGKHNIDKINKENIIKIFTPPPFIEIKKILVTIIVFYLISLLIVHILNQIIYD
jgi:hypothetical protein